MPNNVLKIFISYSHKDDDFFQVFKNGLNSHLFSSSKYNFGTWEDSKIHLGDFWDDEIQDNLGNSDLAILCISSNFLNSKYIEAKEFGVLISKYPKTLIIPVYFNHCNIAVWDDLSKRQFFKPTGDRYDKATKGDFAFSDLIKFRDTDGKLNPNSNIDLYFQDFVTKVEDALNNKNKEYVEETNIATVESSKSNYSLIPKPTRNFTGRVEELLSFNEKFRTGNIFCVEGLGGTGKSEFVTKAIEDFPSSKIIWFDSKDDSSFESLIGNAGYNELLKSEIQDNLATFLGFKDLIERDEKIIVLDNYQDIKNEQFERFFKFLKNSLDKAKFILINREKLLIEGIDVIHFPLEGLKADSIEFAKKIISNNYANSIHISEKNLSKICDDLHGHPFAIQLAIQLLSYESDDENILQIIKEYKTESDKLSKRLLDEIFNHPKATPEEKEFLIKFSVFRGQVQKSAFEFIYQINYKEPLRRLIDKLMVTLNNGRYTVHPLVREFAYLKLDDKINSHKEALKYYLELMKSSSDLSVQEEMFYHLVKAEEYLTGIEYFENSAEKLFSHGQYRFVQQSIDFLFSKGFKSQKLIIFLTDAGTYLGNTPKELIVIIREAFKLSKQTDEILIEAKITEVELLMALGEIDNPIQKFNELIKECERINFIKGESICLSNLAKFYADGEVKIDIAESIALKALSVLEHLDYYAGKRFAYVTLGNIYIAKKKYLKAEQFFTQLLSLAQKFNNSSDIATAKNGLAIIHIEKKEYASGLEIFLNNLKISLEMGNIGNQLADYFNIASTLHLQNDNSFFEYLSKAYEINTLLMRFEGMAKCLNLFGIHYADNKEYNQSVNYFIEAIAYLNKVKIANSTIFNSLRNVRKDIGNGDYSKLVLSCYDELNIELKQYVNVNELLFQPVSVAKLPGRNEPCFCGTGKKYKNCHGKAN